MLSQHERLVHATPLPFSFNLFQVCAMIMHNKAHRGSKHNIIAFGHKSRARRVLIDSLCVQRTSESFNSFWCRWIGGNFPPSHRFNRWVTSRFLAQTCNPCNKNIVFRQLICPPKRRHTASSAVHCIFRVLSLQTCGDWHARGWMKLSSPCVDRL